jgi:hypothetical protein
VPSRVKDGFRLQRRSRAIVWKGKRAGYLGVLAMGRSRIVGLLAVLCLSLTCCAGVPRVDVPQTAYVAQDDGSLLARYAPVFVLQTRSDPCNRIGSPSAWLVDGAESIRIDPDRPVVYAGQRLFTTARGAYTNLIYRVHFQCVPFPNFTMGRNVGLFVIITLNASGQPVLVTTVHTCGCYLAFMATTFTARDAVPTDWAQGVQNVYGERLPGCLRFPQPFDARYRPVVFLRDGTHRVMDVRIENVDEAAWRYAVVPTPIEPLDSLEHLPLGDGLTTSFYEADGPRKGFVKGSRKPLEMLFVGWLALDFRVGRDKELAPRDQMKTTFYTSLKFWRRAESDMWPFAQFLKYWGWKL